MVLYISNNIKYKYKSVNYFYDVYFMQSLQFMTEKVAEVKWIKTISEGRKKYQEIKSQAVVESYAKFRMHEFDESIRTVLSE